MNNLGTGISVWINEVDERQGDRQTELSMNSPCTPSNGIIIKIYVKLYSATTKRTKLMSTTHWQMSTMPEHEHRQHPIILSLSSFGLPPCCGFLWNFVYECVCLCYTVNTNSNWMWLSFWLTFQEKSNASNKWQNVLQASFSPKKRQGINYLVIEVK